MSTPESIARQIESAIHNAISDAALVFSHHAAPSGSSCALQSRFLDNLVAKFRKQPPNESGVFPVHEQQPSDEVNWNSSVDNLARPERDLAQTQETLTFDFAEEATWASLIAEAGFCAQEGNFF
jgi:hypothetical protein